MWNNMGFVIKPDFPAMITALWPQFCAIFSWIFNFNFFLIK